MIAVGTGGISIALVLAIPEFPQKPMILAATYAVVIFSIVVQGLTLGPLVRRLVKAEDNNGRSRRAGTNNSR